MTGGQEADVNQAEPMIRAVKAGAYIADRAYDSEKVVRAAERRGARAIIPPRKNRKVLREYDKHTYKRRFKVEWLTNMLEQNRRAATRHEKTKRNFLSFVHVASRMTLLR